MPFLADMPVRSVGTTGGLSVRRSAEIWRVIDTMMGRKRTVKQFRDLAASQDVAEKFLEVFSPAAEDRIPSSKNPVTATADSHPHAMNVIYTAQELPNGLQKCASRSSPGSEGISYQALKTLPVTSLRQLLNLFNVISSTGIIP